MFMASNGRIGTLNLFEESIVTVSVMREPTHYQVTIDGTIKSVSDSQSIKDAIVGCTDTTLAVQILILNSFSVTSSVIGFLLKKVQADKLGLTIQVTDERLYDLFKSLNLNEILKVSKVALSDGNKANASNAAI
ncbi:hypothetical protein AGMMS50229_07110 [Campylobacterota bacterium]|nr:hypothetical protein AGMMS50229_07110 [Campylobacterota bacterium]